MTDYSHDIEKYLRGELTPAERHALEKKALDDPFVADALEGAEQISAADFSNDVAQLNRQLAGKKTVSVWMWTARIAAGLAFILVATFIVWNILETEPTQDLALKNTKPEEASGPAGDSVTSTDALTSPPAEQPTAEPSTKDSDPAKQRPAVPQKTEPKPQVADRKPEEAKGEIEIKNEPATEAIASKKAEEAVKEKADEIKVTEALAQSQTARTESSRAKAADDRTERSSKKAFVPDREIAAPTAADKSAAGFVTTANVVQGKITSAEDGSPIPGVNVLLKNSTLGTTTDAEGNYQIKVEGTDQTLVYSFIGMQTTEIKVNDRQQVDIAMAQDVTQLSEVVTVGYGAQSERDAEPPTVEPARPDIGSRAFKQYLEKNINYPAQAKTNNIEGRVTVEFTIQPNGSLSNFTVIRGIGSGCDEELIRLIKEGPAWIPTKKDGVPVQDKAKVRLKFELP